MTIRRDQFKSSYGAFRSRERDLARSRALRDVRDAAEERATEAARPSLGGSALAVGAALVESGRSRG